MPRIRALLPLIGNSPFQLLSSLPPTSEFCAMSLSTLATAHVFFYRSSTSNFSIGSLLAPMFLTGAHHLRLSCAGAATFAFRVWFFFRVRAPHRCTFTLSPAKTRGFAASTRSHSERSGRVQFPRIAFRSARPRSRSAYFAADASRRIPHKVCIPQNRHCENPPRVKTPRQRNPTLRICSSQRNLNLNFGR